uniref:Uncharacterized protein n=1 Tax=Arundo donax TaxID=35708 RepID=A0A0A9GI85_ARUDO
MKRGKVFVEMRGLARRRV